jgi:nicotinamide-nucleotide amidase
MSIEIVAIGDEVLAGIAINTNAAFISAELSSAGWEVARHTVLPDNPHIMEQELAAALERSFIVLVTGGLGPTCDDFTRSVVAKLFGSPFHYDETIAADLKRRYGEGLLSLKDQATVPTLAKVLPNPVGTAPGLIFSRGEKRMILMPGVPPEMRPMFTDHVLPYLLPILSKTKKLFSEQIHICLLPENRVDPLLRTLKEEYPGLGIGIYPGYGTLTVALKAETKEQLVAPKKRLVEAFHTNVFPAASGKIEEALHSELRQRKQTLACAESCTGGMIAEKLTTLPNASDYFLGSVVAYSNSLKQQLLFVSEDTLQTKGAVSGEVVVEMLSGILKQSGADFGIAVSGIAGPSGGTPEKPVGTIWAAYGQRGKPPQVVTFVARGNRQTIILSTATRLMGMLWRQIVHGV